MLKLSFVYCLHLLLTIWISNVSGGDLFSVKTDADPETRKYKDSSICVQDCFTEDENNLFLMFSPNTINAIVVIVNKAPESEQNRFNDRSIKKPLVNIIPLSTVLTTDCKSENIVPIIPEECSKHKSTPCLYTSPTVGSGLISAQSTPIGPENISTLVERSTGYSKGTTPSTGPGFSKSTLSTSGDLTTPTKGTIVTSSKSAESTMVGSGLISTQSTPNKPEKISTLVEKSSTGYSKTTTLGTSKSTSSTSGKLTTPKKETFLPSSATVGSGLIFTQSSFTSMSPLSTPKVTNMSAVIINCASVVLEVQIRTLMIIDTENPETTISLEECLNNNSDHIIPIPLPKQTTSEKEVPDK